MRLLSRTAARQRLAILREEFRAQIAAYEPRAKSCETCETPGACCLDAHFVNVRVSRLEAEAIRKVLDALVPIYRTRVFERIARTEITDERYSCPLFEPRVGCLVHREAKPLPCIAHACYERKEDLPPDHILAEQELLIDELNRKTYGLSEQTLPIPIAIKRLRPNV